MPAPLLAQAEPASTAPDPRPAAAPPPPLQWQYQLSQGEARGQARLRWQPEDQRYQASLERQLEGRSLPGWRSEGGFDAGGLAPERYALQRRGRDSQATNFRRELGLISFSASAERVPLPPGVQDRLSWMLQLAALLAANPDLRQPGRQLELPVAGLRGAAGAWRFEVRGLEALQLPVGAVPEALHLVREAQGPYDARIEVWLDPDRHYLPVRLRHSQGEQREWELLLQAEEHPSP